jgi:hypothetical protein
LGSDHPIILRKLERTKILCSIVRLISQSAWHRLSPARRRQPVCWQRAGRRTIFLSVTGGAYNYQFQEIRDKPKNTNLLKLDFMPAPKDTITIRGRNYWSDGRSSAGMAAVNSNWPQFRHHYLFTEDSVKVGWTRVIGPSTVNEFSIGFRDLGERGHGGYQTPAGFEPLIRSANGMTLGQFNPEVNPSNFIPAASFGGVPNPVNITFDARIPIDAGDQDWIS